MNQSTNLPSVISIVSGKGGVGKTLLAANFSYICSRFAKTVIIDLDFQNQGLTGLFAGYTDLNDVDALDLCENPDSLKEDDLNLLMDQLYFIPSVIGKAGVSQGKMKQLADSGFKTHLTKLVEILTSKFGFEIIVLDCHGGIDQVSLASFQVSDHTLMMAEADSVAFAGTLELINFYQSSMPEEDLKNFQKVKIIINRLPSKYKWKSLQKIYGKYMEKQLGRFSSDRGIFCYIPSDSLLAHSFGEYPFFVKLAKTSIFTKKLLFIVHSLFSDKFDLSGFKVFRRLSHPNYKNKIERVVKSSESRIRSMLINFFNVSSFSFMLGILAYYWVVFSSGDLTAIDDYAYIIFVPVILIMPFYLKIVFTIMYHIRDKYIFQKRLSQEQDFSTNFWRTFSMIKLTILRVSTVGLAVFWVAMIFLMILALIGLVIDPTL